MLVPILNLQWQREMRRTKLQFIHLFSFIYAGVVLLYDKIDKRCWNFETTYNYTVKPGCIAIDRIISSGVSLTASLPSKGLVLNKIEVFLWQLMHDSLCTRELLAYMHHISSINDLSIL